MLCVFSTTKGGDVPKIYQKANNEYQKRAYAEKSVVVGINFPSFHVNCRTCTCPYIQTLEEFNASEGERAARDVETDKTVFVPDMTYEEWYKEYIASDPENLLIERKLKNESSDRIQYERYKERLGKDAPKSFAKFQDLKYTDIDGYEDLKGFFRYKHIVPNASVNEYKDNLLIEFNKGKIRSSLPEEIRLDDKTLPVTINVKHALVNGVVPKNASVTSVRIMAGDGVNSDIRDRYKLSAKYGGLPARWQKYGGIVLGDNFKYDIHWYENRDKSINADETYKLKGVKKK